MKSIKRLPKTIFVLFVLIFLPAVFFTIYEYRSLKNNEQVITDVYQQQMDALLFAVNQHIWNDLENRIQKLEHLLQMSGKGQYKAAFVSFFKSGSPITAIAPENHSRIFEKFYRDSSALFHNTKGSGLGL